MHKVIPLLYILVVLLFPQTINARTTPEDIINAQMQEYKAKLTTYSPENRQKIQDILKSIAETNANSCAYLEAVTLQQGLMLDEYLSRKNFKESESVKDARYWLTFAHEAIDYQKQRIYTPTLTGEANIQRDLRILINNLQSQLNYARSTAVKSQTKITNTISGLGSQKIVNPIQASQSGQGD